jgi:hypothetical protein
MARLSKNILAELGDRKSEGKKYNTKGNFFP